MKKILTLFTLLITLQSLAQKRQNVYYIKNEVVTQNTENADYRRIIQEPDSGSLFYNVFEFYPNDVQKTIGRVSNFERNLIYEGLVKKYNKKGILIDKSNYKTGKLNGESSTYYEDGKPKRVTIYNTNKTVPANTNIIYFDLQQAYDSLGNQIVKDGNGYYKEVLKNSTDEGNYVNGQKNGLWKGTIGENSYEESYDNGKFISGVATLPNGKITKYKVQEEMPEYRNGLPAFYSYLSNNIKYPKEAKTFNTNGKIHISFVVDKDGSLDDITFRNKLGNGIEDEIIRVMQQNNSWFPGKSHGIPVRVKYNIALNFKP